VEAAFPELYFEVLSSSKNGTYHVVRTKQRGFTSIDGELNAVVHTVCIVTQAYVNTGKRIGDYMIMSEYNF
jgi:hypothetical protein